MKVAICSAVWGRLPLTRIWWKGVSRIRQAFLNGNIESQIFVGGDEPEHHSLCLEHGADWIEVENNFLGAKWNCVARKALAWGADYIFILGSDDFFGESIIAEYVTAAGGSKVVLHVGLKGVYIHDSFSRRTLRLILNQDGYYPTKPGAARIKFLHRGKTPALGTGRMLHRSLFAGRDHFWEPEKNRALDASITATLGLPPALMLSPGPDKLVVDVKTGTNIWSFDSLLESFPDCLMEDDSHLHSLPEWDDICTLAIPSPGS